MIPSALYLASTSPRRRQLLCEANIAFEQLAVSVDEEALTATYRGPLDGLGEYLAREKARAGREGLRAQARKGLVLAADTTVLLEGESLAKPADENEARSMLRKLRGKAHIVATGVALAASDSSDCLAATSRTEVVMRSYSDEEIAAFVATGDPLDKAGAYSIQHAEFQPVASFRGCHTGVVGLPLCIVAALVAGGPLPPEPGQDGLPCRWSSICARPLPGPESIRHLAASPDQVE